MEKENNIKVNYMYKVAFSSGNVFSASMIDTLLYLVNWILIIFILYYAIYFSLLYQAFSKPYLIEFVRLLIGINQNVGSGSLSAVSK